MILELGYTKVYIGEKLEKETDYFKTYKKVLIKTCTPNFGELS